MAEVVVFDMHKVEQNLAWAKAKYGVAFRRAEVAPGQKVYRLMELREKTGHHSLITQVLDEDGLPVDQMDVAFYWPDAPDPPDPPTEVYPHDWYFNFLHGPTNKNGEVGPGMGSGAWIDVEPQPPYNAVGGGPHAVWVRDPNIPSDICEGLGMRGGTNHDHLDQKFRLVTEKGEEMPGSFHEVESKRRFDRTEGTNHIAVNCEEDSVRDFSYTMIELRVGADHTDPDWVDPSYHYPKSAYHYNVFAGYDPPEGEEGRTFWVFLRHSETGKLLCEPLSFEFITEEYGIHHAYLTWAGDEEPPEDPDEPDEPPEEEPSWTMSVERRPGNGLLIGMGLPQGTLVTVRSPWGHDCIVVAGSKAEYGSGGWEVNIWHPATYTIEFLEESFAVDIGRETVILTFEEGEPAEAEARLVTDWMPKSEAEELLEELEDEYEGVFALEEK